MKRIELVRILEKNGFWLKNHGGNHDKYTNGTLTVAVPHHREIKDALAKSILKEAKI